MTLDLSTVMKCSVKSCTYNKDSNCHARAITVGDGIEAHCDTYFNCGKHCKSASIAGIGACKVSVCRFNIDFECTASSISVEMRNGAAECCACELMR